MPAEVLEERAPAATERPGGGGPRDLGSPGGDGGFGPSGIFGDPTRFGIWAFMGTVTMLFIGFTSAYMVRKTSADWRPLPPPAILWVNTALLLASSVTLQRARRFLRDWDLAATRTWVAVTGALGGLFVAGQLAAWRRLVAQGVYLASNPHSSFFYILTGLHGLHLLGGLAWFAVIATRVWRLEVTSGEDGLGLFATYWHFLGALWIYLLFLLFVL